MNIREILNTTPTTKEEYLAYRAAWKVAYRELSTTIRKQKGERKSAPNGYVSGLLPNRWDARAMMEALAEVKEAAAARRKEVTNVEV